MSAVAATMGLSRSTLTTRLTPTKRRRRGRPPQPDDDLLVRIKAVIADMPTYGYRRVHAILRRAAEQDGGPPAPNHKRVWRVMKQHGLLLQRHAGARIVATTAGSLSPSGNRHWCSDGFEVGCDNGERVRFTFALDCCDREAMSFIATAGGITGEHVRDLMVAALAHRFGAVDELPNVIEWLSDNGGCYIARDTRRQPKACCGQTCLRRTIALTTAASTKVSATNRVFSASDQRRRRAGPVGGSNQTASGEPGAVHRVVDNVIHNDSSNSPYAGCPSTSARPSRRRATELRLRPIHD